MAMKHGFPRTFWLLVAKPSGQKRRWRLQTKRPTPPCFRCGFKKKKKKGGGKKLKGGVKM